MKKDPFAEYYKTQEPDKRYKGYAWSTAIGLQAVDGLETSDYLKKVAVKNIEGEISIDEAKQLIDSYYEQEDVRNSAESSEEADKVAQRITELLAENAFSFTPPQYYSIHKRLFDGIYDHAGKIRTYNITKKEWILDGATVIYGSATELEQTVEYDINQEKHFSYKGLSIDDTIKHLAVFVAGLWQIHAFGEGNTRTTAVFLIKYLRTLGFDVTNDIFAENSWYFRNALVRANYRDVASGINETTEYLELFLRNLILGESNEMKSRNLHINAGRDPINDPINDPIKLSDKEETVYNLLIKDGSYTRMELADKLGCSDSTIKRTLAGLVEKGKIKRVGSNKNGKWEIV